MYVSVLCSVCERSKCNERFDFQIKRVNKETSGALGEFGEYTCTADNGVYESTLRITLEEAGKCINESIIIEDMFNCVCL